VASLFFGLHVHNDTPVDTV